MGFPDAPNGYHWHRSPDGSLDVRRNSGNNGPRKEFDENSGTFRDRPEPDLTRANVGNSTQFDNLSNAQRQRLDDLNGDRNTARTDRDAHEKGTDEYNEANHRVIQQSHQLGEEAAEMYMESLGGNRIFPDGDVGGTPRSGEFDQIWEVDGQIYIVEAKGGSSGLGSRSIGNNRRAQQGTREYMDSILDNMDRNGQGDLATRIRGADAIDDLNYIQVRQPISRTGELGPISVSEFNL